MAVDVSKIAERLQVLWPGKWWMDTRRLAAKLNIRPNELEEFLAAVQKGGQGIKSKETWSKNAPPFDTPIDLEDESKENLLNLHKQAIGKKGKSDVASASPSESAVDERCEYCLVGSMARHDSAIKPKAQREIVFWVVGTHKTLVKHYPDLAKERQKIWKSWVNGEENAALYDMNHLPYILNHLRQYWNITLPTGENLADSVRLIGLSSGLLKAGKREIIELLVDMFVVPPSCLDNLGRSSGRLTPPPPARPREDGETAAGRKRPREDDEGLDESSSEEESDPSVLMTQRLTKTNIRQMIEDGEWIEAGSLHIAAGSASNGHDRIRANAAIAKLGGVVRSKEEYEAIVGIGKSRLNTICSKIDELQNELMGKIPLGLFQIADDEYLLSWLVYGTRWNDGERLKRRIMQKSKDNSQPMLTEESAHIIRTILFEYKIPLSKFGGLLNLFAVLLLGRELDDDQYPATATIRVWLDRLAVLDKHYQRDNDRRVFLEKSKYGFDIIWGITADDTQHGHKASGKTHVCIRVTEGGDILDDGDFQFDGSFDCITNSKAVTEDNKGNADLNFESFIAELDPEVVALYGLFIGDNAALREGDETMARVIDWLENHEDQDMQAKATAWGVKRRVVVANDLFHNCALLCNDAGRMMAGEKDKTNLREFHARRTLQQFHDIGIRSQELSTHVSDEILADWGVKEEDKPDRSTHRQREQRWGCDAKFCERINKGMKVRDPADPNNTFWHEWAKRMSSYFDKSNFRHEILEQISLLLSHDGIVVCLVFDAEVWNKYFRVTHKFHSYLSENCPNRPGLDIMGIANFFIGFICPFWQGARENPAGTFPETVAAIDAMGDAGQKKMKMEQLEAAIEAANEKMAKLYERWLTAPLCFLILTNPVHGPPLLRVILGIVDENEDFDLYDPEDRYSEGLEYETKLKITHDENAKFKIARGACAEFMSESERAWFELLKDGKEDVFHFFQQFGFGRSVMRPELIRLSQEEEYNFDDETLNKRSRSSRTPLRDFFDIYPGIYDCIKAAFARCPSNSRIGEMAHAFTRDFHTSQTPMSRLDQCLRHLIGKAYAHRRERRGMGSSTGQNRKHLDSKEKQTKSGEQVRLEVEKLYSAEMIARLPDHVKDDMKIGRLKEDGARRKEEERNARIVRYFEDIKDRKKRRNQLATLNMDDIRKRAKTMHPEHDLKWNTREYTSELAQHRRFLLKSHWTEITGKIPSGEANPEGDRSRLHREIRLVLPSFHSTDVAEATASKLKGAKSDDNINLGKHLKKIESIVSLKEPNTLTDHEMLDELSELERIKLFVKAERSPHLGRVKEAVENKRKSTKGVLKLFGTTTIDLSTGEDEDDDSDEALQAFVDS